MTIGLGNTLPIIQFMLNRVTDFQKCYQTCLTLIVPIKKVQETDEEKLRQGNLQDTSPAKEQKKASAQAGGGGDEEISAKTNQSGPDNGFHAGVLTLGQLFP